MQDLQEHLSKLPKVSPSKRFIVQSKGRLIHQIQLQKNETWFSAFLKKLGIVKPSQEFVSLARMRLIRSIQIIRQPLWSRMLGLQNKLIFVRRLAASTLIMLIAVTSTLFLAEGGQVVSAAEDTYIEVVNGEVIIKHADNLIWDEVNDEIELAVGDLIKLSDGAEAVVHFFDDSQLRLTDSSILLISKLGVSPAYARQGIIEVSLHEGNAWVQTLNVSDGYAGFTMITRDAIAKTVNATFSVESRLQEATTFSVYNNKIELSTLHSDTREVINVAKVNANQQVQITPIVNYPKNPNIVTNTLSQQDLVNNWVQVNLQRDHDHLVALQESELNRLKLSAGSLPGEFMYSIKQAKERLKLAVSFGESNLTETQIEIANRRLNEAIVLLQEGNKQKATELLMVYQSIVREIAEVEEENIAHLLVTPHQKSLIASLPSDVPIRIVKEALNQTEELFAEDSIEKEQVRLENSVERLADILLLIKVGNIDAAKEALVNHELSGRSILDEANTLEDEDVKREVFSNILELQNEELNLLKSIVAQVESDEIDPQFASMVESASRDIQSEVSLTIAYIKPLMPEIIKEQKEIQATKNNVQMIVEKVYIYNTWQGQKNQLTRLLRQEGAYASNLVFMIELRDNLEGRARDYVNTRILELERIAIENKSEAVQRKINQAISVRLHSLDM